MTEQCGIINPVRDNAKCLHGVKTNTKFCDLECNFANNETTGNKYNILEVQDILAREKYPKKVNYERLYRNDIRIDEMWDVIRTSPRNIEEIRQFEPSVYILEEDFVGLERMGREGSYGDIYTATNIINGTRVTLKRFKKYNPDRLLERDAIKEIVYLRHLNKYPETKTVKYYGIAFNRDHTQLYLVLEYLPTDLSVAIINKNKRIGGEQLKIIFYQILKAFNAIHGLGFMHNDIKANNIMILDGDIRIIDMGLACYHGLGTLLTTASKYFTSQIIKAPDDPKDPYVYSDGVKKHLVRNFRKSYKSDAFMIGILMIFLANRNYYKETRYVNPNILLDNVNDATLLEDRKFGALGYDLLTRLLEPLAKNRYSCKQALTHSYFSGLNSDIKLDMPLLMGGDLLNNYVNTFVVFSENAWAKRKYELVYIRELHNNYKNQIIYYNNLSDKNHYTTKYLIYDWALKHFNDSSILFSSIDVLINSFIMYSKLLSRNLINTESLTIGYFSIIAIIYNLSINDALNLNIINNYQELINYGHITDSGNRILVKRYTLDQLNKLYIQTLYLLNGDFGFVPIHVHIDYIFSYLINETTTEITKSNGEKVNLKLAFELLRQNVNAMLILFYSYFVQPTTNIDYSVWCVTQYCYIRALSKLLKIDILELVTNPFSEHLRLDIEIFTNLHTYYNLSIENIPRTASMYRFFLRNNLF
jgi:serine/threonine protein kinase